MTPLERKSSFWCSVSRGESIMSWKAWHGDRSNEWTDHVPSHIHGTEGEQSIKTRLQILKPTRSDILLLASFYLLNVFQKKKKKKTQQGTGIQYLSLWKTFFIQATKIMEHKTIKDSLQGWSREVSSPRDSSMSPTSSKSPAFYLCQFPVASWLLGIQCRIYSLIKSWAFMMYLPLTHTPGHVLF